VACDAQHGPDRRRCVAWRAWHGTSHAEPETNAKKNGRVKIFLVAFVAEKPKTRKKPNKNATNAD
jgi:hypothetical protein